ncbi:uncharacterized protein PAC_15888 [Phialocephala subalpina]|uniref:Uncharacterized protein n=1 Tax=Phialocephala subalpina TaxID=576137 RepID=A0A1L7XLU8_9HELO|nr:uncharacterized protein PAC_15888 [Phialocephala subalpina]
MASPNPPGRELLMSQSSAQRATVTLESTVETDNEVEPIPARIHGAQNVELKDSAMYGGKGVFATKDIGEGGLVFSIQKPLLAIMGSHELKSVCDNCLAKVWLLKEPDLKLYSTPKFDMELKTCAGCKVVDYCSRDCQKAAWKHHHKHECRVFVAVQGSERVTFGEKAARGNSIVTNLDFRMMIRMLVLYQNNEISDAEWAELMHFANARASKVEQPDFKGITKAMAVLLEKYTGKVLKRSKLLKLINTIRRRASDVYVPLMKGVNRSCEPLIHTTLSEVGAFFDPFVCLIKNACEANAWVVFESNELRFRALRDIPAGTELTISWHRGCLADWDAHRSLLVESLDMDCNCVVFQNRGPGPAPELIERLKKYDDDRVAEVDDADIFGEVLDTIKETKSAGFGTANGMYGLYKHAISGYISRRKTTDAVKHLLELYYVVGPARVPRVYPHFRIDTLHNLLSTLTVTISDRQLLITYPRPQEFEPLPAEVMKLVGEVGAGLHCKLVADTAKYLGEDSMAATFENATLRDYLTNGQFGWAAACQDPSKREYAEVTCNGALHNQYLESMKKLLEWFGIEGVGEDEILA